MNPHSVVLAYPLVRVLATKISVLVFPFFPQPVYDAHEKTMAEEPLP
jgi:hypothetical protein